jgi:hypothetical protein
LFATGLISLLSAWLGPVGAAKPSFADVADLREFVMAALRKEPDVDSVEADSVNPAKFKVTMKGRPSTGDVTNLFGYLRAYPDEDVEAMAARFVRALIQGKARVLDDNNIVAVVRTRDYIDQMRGVGIDILHEPLGADLVITYMIDMPDAMSPIKMTDAPTRDLASIRTIALNNLRGWLPKLGSDDQMRTAILYYVEGNDMLSTSLLLLDDFWKGISRRFPGDVLISPARKDQLILADDDPNEQRRMRRLIDVTIEDNFNLLSPMLYARRSGKFVAVPE